MCINDRQIVLVTTREQRVNPQMTVLAQLASPLRHLTRNSEHGPLSHAKGNGENLFVHNGPRRAAKNTRGYGDFTCVYARINRKSLFSQTSSCPNQSAGPDGPHEEQEQTKKPDLQEDTRKPLGLIGGIEKDVLGRRAQE